MERVGRYGKRKVTPRKEFYKDIPTSKPTYETPDNYEYQQQQTIFQPELTES